MQIFIMMHSFFFSLYLRKCYNFSKNHQFFYKFNKKSQIDETFFLLMSH